MGDSRKRLRCVITGDVQGVGFRWSARERALDLGLTGFVQNLPDGRLEVVAEGAAEPLAAFRTFCDRGPQGARITTVDVTEEPPTGEFPTFDIR